MDVYFAKVYQWLLETKKIAPDVCDWIGVYYKESYLYNMTSTDLVIGPYIGEETEHTRISIDRGFCGMALREERTVNVSDVTKDSTHIACSLKTRSELVVPIANREGQFIAELDIDCNQLNAFAPQIEKVFQEAIKTFPLLEDYVPFKWKTVETKRLVLRLLKESDVNDIYAYCSNPNVARYVTWEAHQTLKDSMKLIEHAKTCYEKGWPEPIAIVLKDDPEKKVIGTVGMFVVSAKNRTFELAYALDELHWGKGILVEASRALIDHAFKHFSLDRLQCRCFAENVQSSRVMEKLGMTFEGIARSSMYKNNKSYDLKVYSLLKSEWRS
ncbi:MAG: GNAT family N-acetyltransferase [Bacteriovorax sp.]